MKKSSDMQDNQFTVVEAQHEFYENIRVDFKDGRSVMMKVVAGLQPHCFSVMAIVQQGQEVRLHAKDTKRTDLTLEAVGGEIRTHDEYIGNTLYIVNNDIKNSPIVPEFPHVIARCE